MEQYKVIVKRWGEIVSTAIQWASSDREAARVALEREAKQFYGDCSEVEISPKEE